MRDELLNLLSSYLVGWKSLSDCAEWFAGINWGQTRMDLETRRWVGALELLAVEVLEAMRPESEFWQEASCIVAANGETQYVLSGDLPEVTIGASSSSVTVRPLFVEAGAVPA